MTTATEPVKPRIGYRMRELADIVSAMAGCSKADALRAAGLPTHGMGSGRELNRAIMAGLIIVEHERPNLCAGCSPASATASGGTWCVNSCGRAPLRSGWLRSVLRSALWMPHEQRPGTLDG